LSSEWRQVSTARRRKYYTITEKGRRALNEQTAEWRTFIKKLLHMVDTPRGAPETS
jgi:DNA-binding PadR family transcriptional regulator